MAKFCSLYSSSSGNCTYVGTSHGGILIDIGVSARKTEQALESIGVSPDSISAVFVTHEHSDHISGIRVFASKHNLNVYASRGTLEGMDSADVFKDNSINPYILTEGGTEESGIFVRPFRTSHDSNESTGFVMRTPDGKTIAVATDMGIVNESTKSAVLGCDLVLLESNHDVGMLQNGPYPYVLKKRILSDTGHLSNDASSMFSCELIKSGTTRLVLGHLSKENNLPYLAFETAKSALSEIGAVEGSDYLLSVAGDLNRPISF